jgi:hypothetical protein
MSESIAAREIPVARVPKYTPVKEGQEHPTGKRGQLKLFHEHVWPKGYTPERMSKINALQFDITGTRSLVGKDQNDPPMVSDYANARKVAHSYVNENLAKSNIPISELEKTASPERGDPLSFTVQHSSKNPSFSANSNRVTLNVDTNHTPADVQRSLVHEVGHAVDWAHSPDTMLSEFKEMRESPIDFLYGNIAAPPRAEGVAEGYAAAHSRITRGNKRVGGNTSQYGYTPSGWFFPDMGETFTSARSDTFKRATGQPFEMPEPEEPKKAPKAKQLNLFGED